MGKQGPCCHCGVTSTPLWRNGPPEKPVLCNACGSRWRTKGTLVNYTPLHARADLDDYEDHRFSRLKNTSMNKNKEIRLLKRKPNHDNRAFGLVAPDYNQGYRKVFDEDMSNRSSSGSAVSNSESYAQFGSADASDLTGHAQSVVWDSMVPSRKRTCVNRPKPSSVEKLTKDLYTILHEQQQSSCFSESSEEDLLFESETPMVSVEIGHGSVLIRHPSSIARDEESEASSLSVENKRYSSTNEVYSHSVTLPVHNEKKSVHMPCPLTEKAKNPNGQRLQQDQVKREKSIHDKLQILTNHNSPLWNIDLNDIINFEEFSRHLTFEEQQQLLKYLPPLDTAELSDSIKNMFVSSQFKENISSYQQLLVEGVFDLSFSGAKVDDCKTLKRITLSNLSKFNWVERYQLLKKCKSSTGKSPVGRGPIVVTSSNSVNAKKSRDSQNQRFQEAKTMRSPKRIIMKVTHESKEHVDNDGSCFSPRSLFALPSDGSSLMLDPLHFGDESSDQDLLLNVPSNGAFPQAELLHPSLSFGQQASTSSSSIYPWRYQA